MAEGRHRRGDHRSADDLLPEGYGGRHRAGAERPADPRAGAEPPADDDFLPEGDGYRGDPDEVADEAAYEPPYDDDGYDPRPRYRERGQRRDTYRRRHPVLVVILAVLVVVVLVVAVVGVWASRQIDPGGKPGRLVTVTIRQGESTGQIGAQLVAAHVVKGNSTLFRYYLRVDSSAPLLPGTYRLHTNESYQSVISVLQQGPVILYDKLVIPEGFTLREIAARIAALPGLHITAASVLEASSHGSVRSAFEPAGTDDLEGLVFPATYQFARTSQTTAATILSTLVSTFEQKADALGLSAAARRRHMTPYQLITVASIVQGEAKLDSDRPKVASVLYNRLAAGTPLGADSTLIYELRQRHPHLDLAKVDYDQPNPYNTRLNKGLPPTPIDNPGLPSLQAATTPASTKDLYFVEVNPDGRLGFASTNAGFVRLEQECRAAKLC